MNDNIIEIRRFLMTKMYKHWKINIMTTKAKHIVSELLRFITRSQVFYLSMEY